MVGRCFSSLCIGGFQFQKKKTLYEFGNDLEHIIQAPNVIGLHCNLVYSSPFSLLDNTHIHYNSNQYTLLQNDVYHKHYVIDYPVNDQVRLRMTKKTKNDTFQDGEKVILENNVFYSEYKNRKSKSTLQLDSVQLKTDDGSSLCISYDVIDDWTSGYETHPDKRVFACSIGNSVYYEGEDITIDGVHKATLYYFQVIPYSDVFVNDGPIQLHKLKIKNCVIKESENQEEGFIIARSDNPDKYLVAVIT